MEDKLNLLCIVSNIASLLIAAVQYDTGEAVAYLLEIVFYLQAT